MQLLIIKGDTNDADYVYSVIDDAFDLTIVKKVAKAIATSSEYHNWDYCGYDGPRPLELYKGVLTEEEIDSFNELCPHSGENGIHTIKSITLY